MISNNDVLRSIRYMIHVNESKLIEIAKLANCEVSSEEMHAFLLDEEEPGYLKCSHGVFSSFLNGLVLYKRGNDPDRPPQPIETPITNNQVLKKLRVAFKLKDEDILDILRQAGFSVSKTELSAFFRKEGHPHYKICGDQFLRNFLKGLTARVRDY